MLRRVCWQCSVSLQPEQVRQLVDVHKTFKLNMARLIDTWRSLGSALASLGPASAGSARPNSSLHVRSAGFCPEQIYVVLCCACVVSRTTPARGLMSDLPTCGVCS